MIKEEPLTLTTEDGANVEVCLYTDDSKRPQTAITIMHPTTDWRQHFILRPLAERGIAALGFTTRYSRREAELVLEHTILDMAAGVKFLRARGYERVCSIGNSGGRSGRRESCSRRSSRGSARRSAPDIQMTSNTS